MPRSGYVSLHAYPVLCALTWADVMPAGSSSSGAVWHGSEDNLQFAIQFKFLLQYDDCLDVCGLCHAQGSEAADIHVQLLLPLCVAHNWQCHWECAQCIVFSVHWGGLVADMHVGRS